MKHKIVFTTLFVLLAGYLFFQLGGGDLIGTSGNPFSGNPCKKAQALTAPTLAELYTFSDGLAKVWNADALLARLDHSATSPLQPNGSSTGWSVEFYSVAADASMQIHTGNGKLYCFTRRGGSAIDDGHLPVLKPDFSRDGAALYALAAKHGQAWFGKGYGANINFWTTDHHGMWHITYVNREGNPAGPRLVVDANSGALEEIRKN